jgi:hypothetical protein
MRRGILLLSSEFHSVVLVVMISMVNFDAAVASVVFFSSRLHQQVVASPNCFHVFYCQVEHPPILF